ncbi:MAG TPA: CAP family protein [Kofleriaceae bacterium]|nr:CAP family protein [Kofleriaceae bacterium]
MLRLPALAPLLVALSCAAPPSGSSETAPPPEELTGPPGGEGAPAAARDGRDAPPAPGPARADPPPASGTKQPAGPPILAAHNRLRARHCAPPLTWSDALVAEARRWARKLAAQRCAFEHNPDPRYGENLAYFRPPGALGPEEIAEQWYREIDSYDFRKARFSMEAGHFTQLVWAGSKRLGCASVECGGGELWVCNYDPPGNMQGDFDVNVRPSGCK